jgi:hypothetical protein
MCDGSAGAVLVGGARPLVAVIAHYKSSSRSNLITLNVIQQQALDFSLSEGSALGPCQKGK